MATRAEVVEKHGEGLNPKEIAAALGIQPNGVYNHLRRAGIHLSGNGSSRRGRKPGRKPSTDSVLATVSARPSIPATIDGEHPSVTQIRSAIGDSIENIELEMHLKRQEVSSLERQHQQLYDMLTVPLPDAVE